MSSNVEQFLQEAGQLKGLPSVRELELREHDYLSNTVDIANIRMRLVQEGKGSQVMQKLSDLADKYKVTLRAHAEPYGDGMPRTKLKRWYKFFGFKDRGQNWMVRKASWSPPHTIIYLGAMYELEAK